MSPSNPFTVPPGPRGSAKPHYSYAALIGQALMASDSGRLSLNQIYTWISLAYPYFKRGESGWQNSIRHNLSLNGCFVKIKRDDGEKGKGSWWAIREGDLGCFAGGGFQRQGRANGRKRKGKAEKEVDEETGETSAEGSPKKKKKPAVPVKAEGPLTASLGTFPRPYSRSASTSTTATSTTQQSYESSTGSYAGYTYGFPLPPQAPQAQSYAPPQYYPYAPPAQQQETTHVRTPASNGFILRPAVTHSRQSSSASEPDLNDELRSEGESELVEDLIADQDNVDDGDNDTRMERIEEMPSSREEEMRAPQEEAPVLAPAGEVGTGMGALQPGFTFVPNAEEKKKKERSSFEDVRPDASV